MEFRENKSNVLSNNTVSNQLNSQMLNTDFSFKLMLTARLLHPLYNVPFMYYSHSMFRFSSLFKSYTYANTL